MAQEAPYNVEAWDIDEFFEILMTRLPDAQQKRITDFMAGWLTQRPKQMIPGQLKELKGKWKGVYQLDCGTRRLHYEVDDATRTVRIISLGEHPDWSHRRRTDAGR
jgi:mRNA-degrading endonuclease RelE of RelBE toxin-antitoxin system